MRKDQTLQLLRLLAAAYPTLKITAEVFDTWHFALSDENFDKMLAAIRHVIRWEGDKDFMPTIAKVFKISRELSDPQSPADQVWSRGPRGAAVGFEREVWHAWGGPNRFGALPDPKYSDDHAEAATVLSFARKEFIELFNSMKASNDLQPNLLTQIESHNFLKTLAEQGANLEKLGIVTEENKHG